MREGSSVRDLSETFPPSSSQCASASESGAGPRTTLPLKSYCEPWHGHWYLSAAMFHGTTQPRCVQTALIAKSASVLSCFTIR